MTRINANIGALRALNARNTAGKAYNTSLERLSTGKRINRAADDAAGLIYSEQLRSQKNGLSIASRNAEDAWAVAQTAESALGNVTNILQRMRDLSVQAANEGTVSAEQQTAITNELTDLVAEIDRVAVATKYTDISLLTGVTLNFQIGPDGEVAAENDLDLTLTATDSATLGVNALDVTSRANAQAAIESIDDALSSVGAQRGTIGATQNRLDLVMDYLASARENITAAESRVRDVDMAEEMTNLTRNQIMASASNSMLAQANSAPQSVLQLLG